MTNPNTARPASTGESRPKELPILWSPKNGDVRHGVSLWVNREPPRVIEPATETTPAKLSNPPHMYGYLNKHGATIPVAAWLTKGRHGPFVVLKERNKRNEDGSFSNQRLGTGNAMNAEAGKPFPPNRTPYMIFDIDGEKYTAMASEEAINYMEELGFQPEIVDNYENLVEVRKAAARTPKPAEEPTRMPRP